MIPFAHELNTRNLQQLLCKAVAIPNSCAQGRAPNCVATATKTNTAHLPSSLIQMCASQRPLRLCLVTPLYLDRVSSYMGLDDSLPGILGLPLLLLALPCRTAAALPALRLGLDCGLPAVDAATEGAEEAAAAVEPW